MKISARIKYRRKELGLSVDDLAKQLGKNRATIYRYENGDIENLPLDILEPIAAALRTTPAYLMGWGDENDKEKKPADNSELSENQKMLIEFAKSVPDDKAALVLRTMKAILEDG